MGKPVSKNVLNHIASLLSIYQQVCLGTCFIYLPCWLCSFNPSLHLNLVLRTNYSVLCFRLQKFVFHFFLFLLADTRINTIILMGHISNGNIDMPFFYYFGVWYKYSTWFKISLERSSLKYFRGWAVSIGQIHALFRYLRKLFYWWHLDWPST